MPTPLVYWAQNETDVYLRVDLKNVITHEIAIEEEEVELTAIGEAANGPDQRYHLVIEFFLPVDKSESNYEIKDREIRINLKKKEPDWWPRLLYQQQKLPWLKIDFDRWKEEGESEDDDDDDGLKNVSSQDMLRQKFPDVFKQLQKDELGYISESRRKIYLFCYNLFMFCGFSYVATVMALRYAKHGEDFISECYSGVGNIMKMLHLFMFLEVLHPLFGYTKVLMAPLETA